MTSKEALEMLKSCGTNTEEPYESKILEALEELVERDTPKIVFIGGIDKQGKFKDVVCPICHQWLTFTEKENFCPKCGQRLDWSESI
jgi:PHP family Zn ribbon phosphoesterase